MADAINLVAEVKKSLNMSTEPDVELDATIQQKINAVKSFMLGAGVKTESLTSHIGISVICMGVNDIWNLEAGEVKFSPAFKMLLTQIA